MLDTDSLPRCETTFELFMSRLHWQAAATHQDASGHYWCDACEMQARLMDLAHAKNYPVLTLKNPLSGDYVLKGEQGYLEVCKTWGSTFVQSALRMLEALP